VEAHETSFANELETKYGELAAAVEKARNDGVDGDRMQQLMAETQDALDVFAVELEARKKTNADDVQTKLRNVRLTTQTQLVERHSADLIECRTQAYRIALAAASFEVLRRSEEVRNSGHVARS
jgi:hypothetical protein